MEYLDEIKQIISKSTSVADSLRNIRPYVSMTHYEKFYSLVQKYNIDISHFQKHWNKGKTKYTDERLKKQGEHIKQLIQDGKIQKSFLGKKHSEETKKKIALSVKQHYQTKKDATNITSLKQLSSRTMSKILQRMNLGCSRCGWNEARCDIHHIHGRKIEDCDNHNNLCCLCPNCHRLVHDNKISSDELITLEEQIGDSWKEYYYWS